jgi:hypothetical protein
MNKKQRWDKRVRSLKEVMVKKFGRELKKGDFLSFTNDWDESSSCKVTEVYFDYFNYPVIEVDSEDVIQLSMTDLKKGDYRLAA